MQEFPLETRVSSTRQQQLDAFDYFDLARRSADLGSLSGAIRMAEQAVSKAEQSADMHALLGMLQVMSAPDPKARQTGFQTLQRALTLDPKHVNSLVFLAEVKGRSASSSKP